jgi:geranylgeranyl diphosphate synthase type II
MSHLKDYLQSQVELIEAHLGQLVPEQNGPYQKLYEAARYALLGGGKRLRPILTLATTQVLGSNPSIALTPACALEMIHAYSLIHDDLPSMDNDDFRRGKPTVHKKFSEGHAILTGDFLLTYAFETLANTSHISAEKKIQLITLLAKQSGSEGMIGGQVMDIASEGQKLNLETLRLLHRNKTGALMTAAIEFGGIMANATEAELNCLRCFGDDIGLAFQIIDDILDVTSSEAKHGKKVASDVLNDKTTFVSLMGLEKSQDYALDLYQRAIHALKPLPYDTTLLVDLADHMIKRQS